MIQDQVIYRGGAFTRLIPSNKIEQNKAQICPVMVLASNGEGRYRPATFDDGFVFEAYDVTRFYK